MKWTIFFVWLAIWALTAPPVRAADQFFEHSYAVVVGIDHYASGRWPQLQYAVKDARAIEAFLRTQDYDQIITLYDRQATKQAIVAAMQDQLARKLKSKDRVLVFFAGHGHTETLGGKDRGYIVPYDGDIQSAGYISMDELGTLSDYMSNARHQLFIMDSCYGGLLAVTRGSEVNPDIPDYLINVSGRVARQVITAGGKDQQVADGGPKGHSYFVDYLLEALEEGKADMNGDGYITFNELSSYLAPRASNRQQTPSFGALSGHQAGEYLFRSPLGRLAPPVSKKEPVIGPVRGAETINQAWTDSDTGLIWAMNDTKDGLDWEHANSYCTSLRLAGRSDWRLPTIAELEGICNPAGTTSDKPYPTAKDLKFKCQYKIGLFNPERPFETIADVLKVPFTAWSSERANYPDNYRDFEFDATSAKDHIESPDMSRSALCVRGSGKQSSLP